MELKQRIQDYTRLEFYNLIQKIERVDGSQEEHNRLIHHFDQIVGQPKGADLLFYPDDDPYSLYSDNASSIEYNVKKWHNDQGQLAFKDDALPSPRPPHNKATPRPSPKDLAWSKSSANLVKVQKAAQQVKEVQQNAEVALDHFKSVLDAAQVKQKIFHSQPATLEKNSGLKHLLSEIDRAQQAVVKTLYAYNFITLTVRFAKDDAQRSASYPHLDRELQASILQKMTQTSDHYLSMLPILEERHAALYAQSEQLLSGLTEQFIQVAIATKMEPQKDTNSFTALLSDVDVLPQILATNPETAYAFSLHAPSLEHAIKSAIGGLAWEATSAEAGQNIKYASVMHFQSDKPGFGEPYAVSTPLSELEPIEGRDWQMLANMKADVTLRFRMACGAVEPNPHNVRYGLKEIKQVAPVYIVSTQHRHLPSKVRVRAATWDSQQGAYIFARPELPVSTVRWVKPDSALGKGMISGHERTRRPDYVASISVPRIREAETLEDLLFDDYIVVFPAESEINPLYVMFRGCRDYPGVADGTGQIISGDWLTNHTPTQNTRIPTQIADQLRGKVFKRFSEFREAFWKAVANTQDLAKQFSSENLDTMKKGHAPNVNWQGSPERVEIHHVVSPDDGESIYDMDNMQIMIPHKA